MCETNLQNKVRPMTNLYAEGDKELIKEEKRQALQEYRKEVELSLGRSK